MKKLSLKTPLAIIGLGISGEAAYNFLIGLGYSKSDIVTFDEKSPKAQVSDPDLLFSKYAPQTLIVSPGVSLNKPWLVAARARGVHITSEINLASSVLENEILVGVTGSVGKSTTTALLGEVLSDHDNSTFVGGNLGTAFCTYALEVVNKKRARAKWVVLELSSYQLENCENLKLNYAIITYFTPNHLERYDSLLDYYKTKLKIVEHCSGPIILNQDSAELYSFKSTFNQNLTSRLHWVSAKNFPLKNLDLRSAKLIGDHNQQNLALAAITLDLMGLNTSDMGLLLKYPGLPHRMEFVNTVNGITFINDSKATSIESVLVSVKSCLSHINADKKIHLLLGGRDKNLPWENLQELSANKNILFYFFGESKDLIPKKASLPGTSFENLQTCFSAVKSVAKDGDWVLLSPGGTSLDQFKNFEERGDFFRKLVDYSVR